MVLPVVDDVGGFVVVVVVVLVVVVVVLEVVVVGRGTATMMVTVLPRFALEPADGS
jgi:hypothetical protein